MVSRLGTGQGELTGHPEKVETVKQFGKATLAILLSAVFALPLPAAPRAGTPAKRTRRYATRYRGVPTFADSSSTDDGAYDDPIVRAAAVSALGRYNGAVVAVDPNTGRILTVVNQKIAFGEGYIPCSTIRINKGKPKRRKTSHWPSARTRTPNLHYNANVRKGYVLR